jgi:biopolymer transport protein ExbD
MAFASMESGDEDAPLTEINMVPLIDVMLVLLIIFMVTAPLLTHAVKVDLPKASSSVNQTRPENVQLAIDANSQVFWNGEPSIPPGLPNDFRPAGAMQPQPEMHIRAERTTPYEKVSRRSCRRPQSRALRIGFITDPSAANN